MVNRHGHDAETYSSVTLTKFLLHTINSHHECGILRTGSVTGAYEISFPIFRLQTFVCQPLLGKFRLEMSLGNVRLRSLDLKHQLDDISFLSFVWKLPPAPIDNHPWSSQGAKPHGRSRQPLLACTSDQTAVVKLIN